MIQKPKTDNKKVELAENPSKIWYEVQCGQKEEVTPGESLTERTEKAHGQSTEAYVQRLINWNEVSLLSGDSAHHAALPFYKHQCENDLPQK